MNCEIKSEVFNMDCLEYMKTLPDNCFDLCIADPPYGIGISGQKECFCKKRPTSRKSRSFFISLFLYFVVCINKLIKSLSAEYCF